MVTGVHVTYVPADRPPTDGCDCLWHRRAFLHLHDGRLGRLPLAYERNIYHSHGVIRHYLVFGLPDLGIEGTVARKVVRGQHDTLEFAAWLNPSVPRPADMLEWINPQVRLLDDPILLFAMPNNAGTLVVWSQAWWYCSDNDPWDNNYPEGNVRQKLTPPIIDRELGLPPL